MLGVNIFNPNFTKDLSEFFTGNDVLCRSSMMLVNKGLLLRTRVNSALEKYDE